jgi:tetratricopeptide (TPR) repeat protein
MSRKAKLTVRVELDKSPPKGARKWLSETRVSGFVCFLFAFLLYSNTFTHSYVYDDFSVLSENWVVKEGVSGIPLILQNSYRYGINRLDDNLYRPLSQLMFAIEWELSPNNPHLNHWLNVLLYGMACMLLYFVLKQYLDRVNTLIPLLTALVFICHPVHTEVVANIKSRDEIMSFFFLMITLLLIHQWFTKKKLLGLAMGTICFFLSLMSKEGVITMIFVFPVIGYFFTKATPKTILTCSIILTLPVLAYMAIRYQVLSKNTLPYTLQVADNFLIAAPDFITKFATTMMLLGKYLMLFLFPYELVSDYSYRQISFITPANIAFLVSFVIYGAMLIYTVLRFKKKGLLVFGLFFFLITISIYSNTIFLIGSAFAERFLFLPSVGLCIALVVGVFRIFKIETESSQVKSGDFILSHWKSSLFFIIILILFSVRTTIRAAEWKDNSTLFSNDIMRSPESAHMCLSYGFVLRDKARAEVDPGSRDSLNKSAIQYFNKTLAIFPLYGAAHEQLGLLWYALNDPDKALNHYEKAISINPYNAETWCNMGSIYVDRADYSKAIEIYQKSISLDVRFADSYLNLGSVFGKMGRYEEALENFRKCIEYNSQKIEAYRLMGLTYQNMNQKEKAAHWLEIARSKQTVFEN